MSISLYQTPKPGTYVMIGEDEHDGTVVVRKSDDFFAKKRGRRPRTLAKWLTVEFERAHKARQTVAIDEETDVEALAIDPELKWMMQL